MGALRNVRPVCGCRLNGECPSLSKLYDLGLGLLCGSRTVRRLQDDPDAARDVPSMSTCLPGAEGPLGYKLVEAIISPFRFSRSVAVFLVEQRIPFRW